MTQAETAEHFNISTRWIRTLQRRYHNGGIEALEPRSKRPHTNPRALAPTVVDRILKLRQELIEQGTNAGAHTIAWHLQRDGINPAPAPSTIHRVLANNGHITPQPQKRPRSSWIRFQADQPNETWQMDYSDWTITGHRKVAILTILDDHSRFIISCHAYTHATVENVGPGPRKVDTSGVSYAAWVSVADVSASKVSGARRLHQECRLRVL